MQSLDGLNLALRTNFLGSYIECIRESSPRRAKGLAK